MDEIFMVIKPEGLMRQENAIFFTINRNAIPDYLATGYRVFKLNGHQEVFAAPVLLDFRPESSIKEEGNL